MFTMSEFEEDLECPQGINVLENIISFEASHSLAKTNEILKQWMDIAPCIKKEEFQMMNLYLFWSHIVLLQQDDHRTTIWAIKVGFVDVSADDELTLGTISRIEILESILRGLERGCMTEHLTKGLILLGDKFKSEADCVDEAVRWLEMTKEPHVALQIQKLGSRQNRALTLSFIFTEYAQHVQARVCSGRGIYEAWITSLPHSIPTSEAMKDRGNELFKSGDYIAAINLYTKAIKFNPTNYILYGNRALCFIRSEKYLKAVGDGKRATLINPEWAKGHYRFCDALFYLGEHEKALQANFRALQLCCMDREGMRDLQQQNMRFQALIRLTDEPRGVGKRKKAKAKRDSSKRRGLSLKTDADSLLKMDPPPPQKPENLLRSGASGDQESDESCAGSCSGKTEMKTQMDKSCTSKAVKGEMAEKSSQKTDARRNRHSTAHGKQQAEASCGDVARQLRSVVQDAHIALADQRCRNAELSFSQALRILDSPVPQGLGISELDKMVLIYGYATALLEIGQPEELAQAEKEFNKIKAIAGREFQCLVYYGIGRVLFKENRFLKALDEFNNALLMVKRQIVPGKLTWPTTKVTIEETQTDCLKAQLEKYIDGCNFPPKPDATCRHHACMGHSKIEIYFTDPDFKGFIRLVCCQQCNVEFHISCWKKMKSALFTDKTDKEILQENCFTPDCGGKICQIVIFDSTGIIKCEFESSIPKGTVQAKFKVKQTCSSLKKLKSKEDRKLRRKHHKQAEFPDETVQPKDEQSQVEQKENKKKASSQSWLDFGDRVLQQISENRELFKQGTPNISAFMKSLQPWLDLDRQKGLSVTCHKDPETLEDVVDLLLGRKNRVWARVFVGCLSSATDVSPKLQSWASRLDRVGLGAAEAFMQRYAEHLEDLDLSPLLTFRPLQDIFMEKLGTMPEFFSSAGLTVTDCLKQAPSHEKRLFVWVLEENREQFLSCHHALNEYFEMMDAVCLVIKKTENENQINSPIKSRNKSKKKKKDPKSIMFISGLRGGTLRDDDEDFLSEEDSVVWLDSDDPFIVPDHLRDQVAEFEEGYQLQYKSILDNNVCVDPTRESLYDYFAQILEEHGPMEADSELLVGELENFPVEAQLLIQEAGGLKEFLIQSLRFLTKGAQIGLMTHALSLEHDTQEQAACSSPSPGHGTQNDMGRAFLNPSAKEFTPLCSVYPPEDPSSETGFTEGIYEDMNSLDAFSATLKDISYFDSVPHLPDEEEYIMEPYTESLEPVSFQDAMQNASKALKRSVLVQVICIAKDDVAVNTEPYEPFERDKGDMIKMENDGVNLEKQMMIMWKHNVVDELNRAERMSSLEAELKEINENIGVEQTRLEILQLNLEEEVRKDQQEKKENQEMLKTLKSEIKDLTESCEIVSKNIKEKKREHQEQLDQFLDASNQSAAEKMSLEDEIKRYRDLCSHCAARSLAAEMSILECRRQIGLRELQKYVSEKEAVIGQMQEMAARFPSCGISPVLEAWQKGVNDAKEKIGRTEVVYNEQVEKLLKGTKLSSLPLVSVPAPLPTPAPPPLVSTVPAIHHSVPRHPHFMPRSVLPPARHSFQHRRPRAPPVASHAQSDTLRGRGSPQPDRNMYAPSIAGPENGGKGGAARTQQPQAPKAPPAEGARAGAQQHASIYERIVDRLSTMFPHYSRPVLNKFIQEVRAGNGGCMNSLTYDEVMSRVAQLILDHQETTRDEISAAHGFGAGRTSSPRSESPGSTKPAGAAVPSGAWKSVGRVGSPQRPPSRALNVEDPCIICHEEMSPQELCVLECRHSFHRECIRSWLKEQSTCPTCREHALLPEDFPQLPGRIRRGPTAAASSS